MNYLKNNIDKGNVIKIISEKIKLGEPFLFTRFGDGEDSYKIGYVESFDGVNWDRIDEGVGIQLSEEGFDSKMMTYPSVIDINGDKHMFYNGNSFGKEGIGLTTHKNYKKIIKNG